MFQTNTLFILGAGASCPYGFPLGKNLIKEIIKNMDDYVFIPLGTKTTPQPDASDDENKVLYLFEDLKRDYDDKKRSYEALETGNLQKLGNNGSFQFSYFAASGFGYSTNISLGKMSSIDIFHELRKVLIDFDPVSIDAFLRDNPKYSLAGKIMIVYSLLKNEDLSKFTINSGNIDNWYSLLLNDLVSQCAEDRNKLLENQLRITTFNYDVSLDYFLGSRLNNIEAFSKNDTAPTLAEQYLTKLTIKHIYGRIDESIEKRHYGNYFHNVNSTRPLETVIFHFKRFLYSIYNCKNIKTMYDERNHGDLEQEIKSNQEDIKWAEDIIIIGFGFDRDNLDLLGFPSDLNELCDFFEDKKIRFLNYEGQMNSLSSEFKDLLDESCKKFGVMHRGMAEKPMFKLIESKAKNISCAYLNDFKKYLFK